MYISTVTEEDDAKNASKAVTQRMARHGTDKCSIVECAVAEAVGAERSSAECQTDADCMAEVDSECQGMLRCQPAESNGMHSMLMFQSHITSCAVKLQLLCAVGSPFSMSQKLLLDAKMLHTKTVAEVGHWAKELITCMLVRWCTCIIAANSL